MFVALYANNAQRAKLASVFASARSFSRYGIPSAFRLLQRVIDILRQQCTAHHRGIGRIMRLNLLACSNARKGKAMNEASENKTVFGEAEEYQIAEWYLSALINGDYSVFDFYYSDEKRCNRAIENFDNWVKDTQAGRDGHWSYYSEDSEDDEEREKSGKHFLSCDVSGLMSDCEYVVFHPIIK